MRPPSPQFPMATSSVSSLATLGPTNRAKTRLGEVQGGPVKTCGPLAGSAGPGGEDGMRIQDGHSRSGAGSSPRSRAGRDRRSQSESDETTSLVADVPTAHQVAGAIVFLTARTVPSRNRTLTTPECRLVAVRA